MTYSALQAKVRTYIERDDLDEVIPYFISDAETRFNRSIYTADREAVATLVVAEEIALPADFRGARSLILNTTPKVVLEQMTLGELRSAFPIGASGVPTHYAISGDTLVLAPVPATDADLILNYNQAIPALSDANTSNWLLEKHPDVYLAGALTEAWAFQLDEQRAALWDARTSAKINEINKAGTTTRYGGPLMARGRAD